MHSVPISMNSYIAKIRAQTTLHERLNTANPGEHRCRVNRTFSSPDPQCYRFDFGSIGWLADG
jgi:hypothetical protein